MTSVERLLVDVIDLFINMSARGYRKEYTRQKGLQKEEAKRKQVRMKGTSNKSAAVSSSSTVEEEVVQSSTDDKLTCTVCQTLCDDGTICCDKCSVWHHLECVGLTDEEADSLDKWFCYVCVASID